MKRVKQAVVVSLIMGWTLTFAAFSMAQTPNRYFPETGHSVSGVFLTFFDTRGGLEIFGYPITDQFEENGRLVQYFQRVRMEWHPENADPYKVQLGLLGDLLGYRAPSMSASQIPPANHPQRRYYPETGHSLAYAFLAYYDSHGGLDIFGYPITDFLIENGRIVQYFQRGKMEWYPEYPSDRRVQLGFLGEIYAEKYVDPERLKPSSSNLGPGSSTGETTTADISVSASLKYAITGQDGTQTLYVYVTDQWGKGVQGAMASFVAHYSDGDQFFEMPPTDSTGYTSYTFDVGDPLPGYAVVVDVGATFGERSASSQTSFLPWW
jgi:hypothetical protein